METINDIRDEVISGIEYLSRCQEEERLNASVSIKRIINELFDAVAELKGREHELEDRQKELWTVFRRKTLSEQERAVERYSFERGADPVQEAGGSGLCCGG